jgi:ABC-type transporter Mla subunit MlaD
MASRSELTRNNVRAGIFVSVCLLLAMAVIIALTDALDLLLHRTLAYAVTYPVRDGVADLQAGSQVRVGGLALGRVTAVRPLVGPDAPLETIAVEFDLDAAVPLYLDAEVVVVSPILGSGAWLEISRVGSPQAGPARDRTFAGVSAPGLLSTLVGAENAGKADAIVDNAAEFAGFLGRIESQYQERVGPALDDFATVARDARAITQELRQQRWPAWAESVDRVMTWAGEFTSGVDQALAEGKALFADGRAVIAENRVPIESTVANLEAASADAREVTGQVRQETVERVHALLARGQEAMDRAAQVLGDLRQDYAGWTGGVDHAVANLALTSQQLKLASQEIRRSPWKLLYRPSATELEHELLYEAARSFVVAATELNAAAEAVDRVVSRSGDALEGDRASFERLRQNLTEAAEKYQKAQEALFDVLVVEP